MDNLVSLLQTVGPAAVNHDVRSKILEYIQAWAAATEGRYELSYINEVYKTLQREGHQFPPKVIISSSMIDSSAVREVLFRHTKLSSSSSNTDMPHIASRVGRLRCLYAMPNRLYFHKPQAPLPELRKRL